MAKNILFVVPYTPNLIRVRPYNLVRSLSQLGHRVTVLTLWGDEAERQSLEELRRFTTGVIANRLPRWRSLWNVLRAVPTGKPLQAAYCWEPGTARTLEALAAQNGSERFDIIHVEHLRGAEFGLHAARLARREPPAPVVWDAVDSISLLFQQAARHSRSPSSRVITAFELGRTQRYEARLLRQFAGITVTSEKDRQAMLDLLPPGSPEPPLAVVPNGVDLDYFCVEPGVPRDPATILVSGKMSYHANISMVMRMASEVMPQVWAQRAEARLLVVGKDPPREVLALGQQPNITVTGTVEHLPPYLQQATIAAAPVAYGAGIQNKVLEAMACATPVVASPLAVSALQLQPGEQLLVAETPADFARSILDLLSDPVLQQRLGSAGRSYVEANHNWAHIAGLLDGVYDQAIHRMKGRPNLA